MMQTYTIRSMTRRDLDLAVAWAAEEGWNPGAHDAQAFYETDPDGFFIGERDGEPIASISAVAYGAEFGFIGFYIVKPAYRGQGYGIALWNHAMTYLQGRNIGLDGVIAQQDNYKKSGFRLAYSNIRFENRFAGEPSPGLVDLRTVPFDPILAYDTRHFPVPRERFLRAWLHMPNTKGYAKWDGTQLRGYGIIRSCGTGYKIGPLFAEDAQIADVLYRALCLESNGEPVYLDVPEVNSAAMALAESYDMRNVFGTARMYTQDAPAMEIQSIFGVTTFELG
ncbi:MAG: GNAT family N-acetyltransferase [bacterium]|jgi:ribosomal protein S18 acetylase RimI-like enzyme|nr:GNAT family N-acetyltransferase [bacterium]